MLVLVPGVARDFSPAELTLRCRLTYNVRTAVVCNHMHQHMPMLKIPNVSPGIDTIVWTHKNTALTGR